MRLREMGKALSNQIMPFNIFRRGPGSGVGLSQQISEEGPTPDGAPRGSQWDLLTSFVTARKPRWHFFFFFTFTEAFSSSALCLKHPFIMPRLARTLIPDSVIEFSLINLSPTLHGSHNHSSRAQLT